MKRKQKKRKKIVSSALIAGGRFCITHKKLTLLCLCCVILILELLRIELISELIPMGANLQQLRDEAHSLDTENMVLREQVLENESLTVIASKAAAMGFVSSSKVVYLQSGKKR